MPALIKRADRFTESASGDEIVIMRTDTGEFFALSGTAAAAWRLIDGERDRLGLIAALADEFHAESAKIAGEVDEFLRELRGSGVLADG